MHIQNQRRVIRSNGFDRALSWCFTKGSCAAARKAAAYLALPPAAEGAAAGKPSQATAVPPDDALLLSTALASRNSTWQWSGWETDRLRVFCQGCRKQRQHHQKNRRCTPRHDFPCYAVCCRSSPVRTALFMQWKGFVEVEARPR